MGLFSKKNRAQRRNELINAINEGLRDPDTVKRLLTLERACRLRRPPVESVGPILLALEDDSIYVRQLAAFVLGRMEDPTTVPMLIEQLKDDNDVLRMVVANALKKIGTTDALRAVRDSKIGQLEREADALSEATGDDDADPNARNA